MARGRARMGASASQTKGVTAKVVAAWILLPAFFFVTGGAGRERRLLDVARVAADVDRERPGLGLPLAACCMEGQQAAFAPATVPLPAGVGVPDRR